MRTKLTILTIAAILGISSLARAELEPMVNIPVKEVTRPPVLVSGGYCGDGIVQEELGETCDAGKDTDTCIGCEIVYTVVPPPPAINVRAPIVNIPPIELRVPDCGDGVLDKDEECDDGNVDDNDGCNSHCKVEPPPLPPPAVYEPPVEAPPTVTLPPPPEPRDPENTVTPPGNNGDGPDILGVGMSGSGACSLQSLAGGGTDLGLMIMLVMGAVGLGARRRS